MKKLLLFLLILVSNLSSFSQSAIEIEDATSTEYQGFEYGYSIDRKTGWKAFISRKEYEEYIVTFFVKNSTNRNYSSFMYSSGKKVICDYLAEFNCVNSIEKRNGLVSMIIYGKAKTVPHSEKEYQTSYYNSVPFVFSKNVDKEALVGYTLATGETVSATVTVIVPKGEKMQMRVKPYGR